MLISICSPFCSINTVLGFNLISFEISDFVFPFEMSSNHLPKVTSVKIIALDSKNIFMARLVALDKLPSATFAFIINKTTKLYRYALMEPNITSVSMFGDLFKTAFVPLVKYLKLIIKIGVVSTSWINAKFEGFVFGLKKFGSGMPSMCPIEIIINGIKKINDKINLNFKLGSFDALTLLNSNFSCVALFSLTSAPYPKLLTASTISVLFVKFSS